MTRASVHSNRRGELYQFHPEKSSRVWLEGENPAYSDIKITEETAFEVWGIIKHSVRMLEAK
jgi:SOS-response transcriptional repressor LexA